MSSCRPDAGPSPPTVRLGAGSSCGSDTCRGSQSYSYGASRPVGHEALSGAPAPWRQQHEVLWAERAQSNVVPGLPPPCVAPCALCVGRRWGGTGTAAPTRPASSSAQFWGKQLPGTCLTAPPKPMASVAPGPASSPWGASLPTGGNGMGAPGFPSPFLGGRGTPWPQRGRLVAGGGTGIVWEEATRPSVLGSKGITPRARMG